MASVARRALGPSLLLAAMLPAAAARAQSVPALFPNGPVAATQRQLLFEALAVMAIVVVPVFVLFGLFAWRYRASRRDRKAGDYTPDWDFSWPLDIAIWTVPLLIVIFIGFLQVTRTVKLDPRLPAGPGDVLHVQAIALDWKYLFLYPDAGIGTVNELVVPAGRPFEVSLTSDTVMNTFFVPGLGGQIAVMAGMETRMNYRADAPAEMWGRNTQFSGSGFPGQHFAVRVVTPADYDAWVAATRSDGQPLDQATYETLRQPSKDDAILHFGTVPATLFDDVVASYGHEMRGMAQVAGLPDWMDAGDICVAEAN